MDSVARPVDIDDDRVMDHPIDDGGCGNRITEIVTELLKVDIARDQGGVFAVSAFDDFVEESGMSCFLLFQAVKPYFVDQENLWREVLLEAKREGLIGQSGKKIVEHIGSGGISAAIELPASDEEERLGNVAFPGTGVPGENEAFIATDEIELGQFHDLSFVDACLEGKIIVRQQLAIWKLRISNPSLDAPID